MGSSIRSTVNFCSPFLQDDTSSSFTWECFSKTRESVNILEFNSANSIFFLHSTQCISYFDILLALSCSMWLFQFLQPGIFIVKFPADFPAWGDGVTLLQSDMDQLWPRQTRGSVAGVTVGVKMMLARFVRKRKSNLIECSGDMQSCSTC